MRDATNMLDAARLNRIVRRAINGDHETAPLPLDDLANWRDEIEQAAQLGIASAWARGWRSDRVLIDAARNQAIKEALAEQRRRGATINHSGELSRLAKRVNADPYTLADDVVSNDEPNPPAGIELCEQAAIARELLNDLPPDERQAIELTTLQGMTIEQAGRVMGIRHQRVSELRAAGLATLREVME